MPVIEAVFPIKFPFLGAQASRLKSIKPTDSGHLDSYKGIQE
jgi:hypothetical protein